MFTFECGKHFGCGKQIIEAHIVGMGGDDALTLLLPFTYNQKCISNSQIANKYFQFFNFPILCKIWRFGFVQNIKAKHNT